MKLKIFIILIILTVIGGFLRLYNNVSNPPSLNIDEVAYGYSAYSILKTGRDEYGSLLPLTFRSVGDYKNPVVIYTMVPSIALLGLNEFSVRLPTAIFAILSIPIFYFLFSLITRSASVSLVATALLTISPWHIYYSRFASDHLIGVTFVVLGAYLFYRFCDKGGRLWAFLAALSFVLSMYTYHAEKLFSPLLITALLIFFCHKLLSRKSEVLTFILTVIVLLLPLLFLTLWGPGKTRAAMVFIGQDIDFTRNVILDHLRPSLPLPPLLTYILAPLAFFSNESLLLFFFWVKRFLNYFQPSFLFFNGLGITNSFYGLGVMYLFELPWLILGIWRVFTGKLSSGKVIAAWMILGLLPASITNNEQSAGRALLILPPLLLISAYGACEFYNRFTKTVDTSTDVGKVRLHASADHELRSSGKLLEKTAAFQAAEVCKSVKKNRKTYVKYIILFSYLLFIFWNLAHVLLVFAVHFPRQKGEAFMEGTKQVVEFALNNKDQYREIVFDPYRGVEAQNIVSVPHLYLLFYSRYDPKTYQTETKRVAEEYYSFNKFTFRRINWRENEDRRRQGVLFVGTPWSLPPQDLKEGEILQKVYLSNGNLVFLIVTPRP